VRDEDAELYDDDPSSRSVVPLFRGLWSERESVVLPSEDGERAWESDVACDWWEMNEG